MFSHFSYDFFQNLQNFSFLQKFINKLIGKICFFYKHIVLNNNKKIIVVTISSMFLTNCAVVAPLSIATTGMVVTDERAVGTIVNDKTIVNRIRYELAQIDWYKAFGVVNVNIFEGRVLLTGNASEQKYIDDAVRIAWSVRGVHEVINEIQLSSRKLLDSTKDVWIANEIRTKFLLEKNFLSSNYVVDVNHSVVYLIGIGQSKEELDKALLITSSIGGVSKIISHVILKDDPRRWGRM